MSITEAKLLASGFTSSDLQKLRKYITKDALSLDMVISEVISDLSRRFNAALLLTILLAAVYLIVLIIASRENVVSTGVAMLIALFIIWFFQPPFLSYKAWKIKKKYR
ncbi:MULTISPECIES: hypothetical protein [Enterobacter]|uniref:Uncharacterized protein n=1 Tax=Enterobacter cloacae TaxID=550 RepID=A0AA42R3W2_ENTCL|nr:MULTISPECIES: hypothetical protein [Enterobacter]HAS0831814.1 hypothetical protein [Enterobacter cloacae subsp. cloacae]MDH0438801.1 hypothetical protein [Enterobacter cloacae]MDH1483032.1 hypothetical protein [Enterobacter cloacae]NWJ78369.1 hypothetical protein [Enterobacter sp. SECR19-1250]QUG52547.1 hypothetical protein KDU74_01945 [Enterobacter cloacae]